MNYQKIYNQLIKRAQQRSILPGVYSEKHHIIPRCMSGTDDASNIVRVLPEEHYLLHQLLVKIYPNNEKLICAACMMAVSSNGQRINNKLYGWLRKRLADAKRGRKLSTETKAKMSTSRTGISKSEEFKAKISKHRTGKKHSDETKAKLSESRKFLYTEEFREKLSKALKGRVVSAETRAKLSAAAKKRVQTEETKLKISISALNRKKAK